MRTHIAAIAILVLAITVLVAIPVTAAIPYNTDDSYTLALLHMNGSDASQVFTDEYSRTWDVNNHAQIDTAQSKFSGASGLFDGIDDGIYFADSSSVFRLDSGSNNNAWTIDFWVRFNGDPGTANVPFVQQYSSVNAYWQFILQSNALRFNIREGGTNTVQIDQTWNPAGGTWAHVALVKDGANGYMTFVNGTQIGATTTDTDSMPAFIPSPQMRVGFRTTGAGANEYLNGWIDELRISKGIARWTSNFTPPTEEYPDQDVLTATAAYYQTQTAAALTGTAAVVQTQTAAALTQTAAANQTATAYAGLLTQISGVETHIVGFYETQTAIGGGGPTFTPTNTSTAGPPGTPRLENTITYGETIRMNLLGCIGVVAVLWIILWIVSAYGMPKRQQ